MRIDIGDEYHSEQELDYMREVQNKYILDTYDIDISNYDVQYEDTMMEAIGTWIFAKRRRVYYIEFEVNGE